jgi:hypothetical protein
MKRWKDVFVSALTALETRQERLKMKMMKTPIGNLRLIDRSVDPARSIKVDFLGRCILMVLVVPFILQ